MAKRGGATRAKGSAQTAGGTARGKRRSIWTGNLRLALVSVPVALVSATRSASHIALHQIDAKSGQRIRYDKVAPGVGHVEREDIKRGVEVSKDKYVILEDKELEKLKLEAQRTLDLVQFVDHDEIDPIWFDKPYFVLPDGELAEEPYAVLRDALKAARKVGIGQFVMRNRDYVAALKPCGNGMLLETLRFADEVESSRKVFAEIGHSRVDRELLDLADELIDRKTRPFEPDAFHDRYTEALRDLVALHQRKGGAVELEPEEDEDRGAKVIDLVEALKRSVRSGEEARPRPRRGGTGRKAG
jgi:DNA end-binding protein Ku